MDVPLIFFVNIGGHIKVKHHIKIKTLPRSKRRKERRKNNNNNTNKQTNKQLTVKALYLDLEDLKQNKSERRERERRQSPCSLYKKPTGCLSPPGAKSDFGPISREQGYQKSDPGGDHSILVD